MPDATKALAEIVRSRLGEGSTTADWHIAAQALTKARHAAPTVIQLCSSADLEVQSYFAYWIKCNYNFGTSLEQHDRETLFRSMAIVLSARHGSEQSRSCALAVMVRLDPVQAVEHMTNLLGSAEGPLLVAMAYIETAGAAQSFAIAIRRRPESQKQLRASLLELTDNLAVQTHVRKAAAKFAGELA